MKGQKVLFSKKTDDWRTPLGIYNKLNEEFSFNYDPCPYKSNDLTSLLVDWKGRVFVNPPYSNIFEFINKGLVELYKNNIELVVYLVPSRTDTKWWHDLVLKYNAEIRWIRGRLRFNDSKNSAPFPSCILIFK